MGVGIKKPQCHNFYLIPVGWYYPLTRYQQFKLLLERHVLSTIFFFEIRYLTCNIYNGTNTNFTPVDNPDVTTFDPTTIGFDPNITQETITSKSQPISFDSDTGILNINRNVILNTATIGDPNIIAHFTHPNIPGELVITSCQVGGTFYSNNVIIGSGSAQLLCDDTGTYLYNNLNVSGVINNTDLTNKLNNNSSKISMAPATIVLGQPADFTYFVDENSRSYPLLSSDEIVWSKHEK